MDKKIPGKGRSRREGGNEKRRDAEKPRRERRPADDEKSSAPRRFVRKDPLKKESGSEEGKKSFSRSDDRPQKKFFKKDDRRDNPRRDSDRKSAPRKDGERSSAPRRDGERSSAPRRDGERKPYSKDKKFAGKEGTKKFGAKPHRFSKPKGESDFFDKRKDVHSDRDRKQSGEGKEEKRFFRGKQKQPARNTLHKKRQELGSPEEQQGIVRLNKFIANAGICSRREADDYITAGVITVNGKVVSQLGTRINPGDEVKFHDRVINGEKKIYLVLNKPKDYITTTDDPLERRTVMALVKEACRERIYPVGRLDRATTGVLIFTNDGDLTKRLTHPAHQIKKVYQVELDRPFTRADFEKLQHGVELEDGFAKVDSLGYALDGKDKANMILELHSGRNRIVRRIFEALGYDVRRLDRTSFAGISKKELMRGRWRFLTEKEVGFLKMQGGRVSEAQPSR